MFRLIFGLIGIAALALAFIYLAPDSWKEKVLTFIESKPAIPAAIKEKAEELLATPHYRREKLIAELEKNLGSLKTSLESKDQSLSATSTRLTPKEQLMLVEQSEKLLGELKNQNQDKGATDSAVRQIVSKLIQENSAACPTTAPVNSSR